MDWREEAHKALERDEEWITAQMGPMASIVRKYYVRGYMRGVEDARMDQLRSPAATEATGKRPKSVGWGQGYGEY